MPIRGKKHRFTDNNISNSPTDNGVYVLSRHGELIYIGKGEGAGGIKSRLQAAKRGDTRGVKTSTSFQTERSKDATRREQQLLEEYKQKYGKLPRHNNKIG